MTSARGGSWFLSAGKFWTCGQGVFQQVVAAHRERLALEATWIKAAVAAAQCDLTRKMFDERAGARLEDLQARGLFGFKASERSADTGNTMRHEWSRSQHSCDSWRGGGPVSLGPRKTSCHFSRHYYAFPPLTPRKTPVPPGTVFPRAGSRHPSPRCPGRPVPALSQRQIE